MSVLSAILQGIIQGLTEFLPISSSGHLVLFQHFTGQSGENSLFFGLMLHLGTLAAVIAAYYEDLWEMLKELVAAVRELFTGKFKLKTENPHRKLLYMLIVATAPLVLVLPLRGLVSGVTGDADIVVEGVCFLFTSLLLFGASKARPGKAGIEKMRPLHAVIIGIMQGVAVMPGISRSGATLSTGLIIGFNREFMVRFAFLLSIPAILGGAVAEIGDAAEQGIKVSFLPLFLGMLTAAVVGYLCIRLVRWLVVTNRLIIFAWYTLILGAIVVVVGIIEHFVGPFGLSGEAASVASSLSESLPPPTSLA
ncbi:undecaprenyl-diphosphate phosphatase [Ruminococcaceae bacterium OttesenSCG-928-I18]|nr:undecaprenyl-diphosphate phosphatase [Ruminococcaceae bacterium OttesenSCG-928-I18]